MEKNGASSSWGNGSPSNCDFIPSEVSGARTKGVGEDTIGWSSSSSSCLGVALVTMKSKPLRTMREFIDSEGGFAVLEMLDTDDLKLISFLYPWRGGASNRKTALSWSFFSLGKLGFGVNRFDLENPEIRSVIFTAKGEFQLSGSFDLS